MNNENFDLVTNDENEEFTVEFGEIFNDGGTHDYNELDNKPKINGNTLEGNKTNEQLGIPVYTEGTGIKLSGDTISADTDVLATKADLNSKQNVIADLPQIRSGAEAGATAVQPEDLARIATTGSYNDSLDKPSINNVTLTGNKTLGALGIQPKGDYALESEIPDVSNFITNTVDNLVNYYKKSETFTKQEVNNLISAITTMDIQVVQTLPTEDISTTTIYFVPKATTEQNDAYDEYIYVSNAWEHIGSTDIDLSGYQTKIDSSHKLSSDLVDDTNKTNKFVTSAEKTTWNGKYTKPSGGIPKSDLASAVQTSLGKADTALQSISSSDVTTALGYTPYNSTNPNGYTSNVGTITGITMNGASKGTSGVVDLGTVITSHQDISGKANKISVVQTSASTIEINPNTFYKFGEVASLNITLASITDNTIYNEYMFEFVSGTTATTLTLPSSIKWLETPTIGANKIYQCSIVDNIGILVGVANV